MASNLTSLACKRVCKDLKELNEEIEAKKLVGVNAMPYNDNISELHANIIPSSGPYKGVIMHVVIAIPSTYPQASPSGRMSDGFPFNHSHHEHIHLRGNNYVLCADYLSDFEFFFKSIDGGQIQAGYGWTPAMTISKLLVSLQQFFAQTDLSTPSEKDLEVIKQKINNYVCACGHKTSNPHPILINEEEFNKHNSTNSVKEITEKIEQLNNESKIDADKNTTKKRSIEQIKELTTCSFTRENVVDNNMMILGYPILATQDKRNRIHSTLIPEPISYEFFATETQKNPDKLDYYSSIQFRTASGKLYNQFLPIYINEAHFKRSQQHIENAISILSADTASGQQQYDFKPMMILRVIPNLMNQMVVMIMNCNIHESENIIMAYCHLMRLFVRFADAYPVLVSFIRNKIQNFVKYRNDRIKTQVPDLGEFIVMLGLNAILKKTEKVYTYTDPDMKNVLMDEFFARQVFWIEKDLPNVYELPQNDRLTKCFQQTAVSIKLLVFNIMFSKKFLFHGVTKLLDDQYGLPPAHIVESFQQLIKRIKNIGSYRDFLQAIDYFTIIDTPEKMIKQLDRAKYLSDDSAYTGIKQKKPTTRNVMNTVQRRYIQ